MLIKLYSYPLKTLNCTTHNQSSIITLKAFELLIFFVHIVISKSQCWL